MTHMTETDYLDVQHRMHVSQDSINKSIEPIDEPESGLSKWLRQYCKDHGYPALVFPQTQNVRNFLPAGFPDAIIILHNRVIFMELKRPHGGRKSPKQKEMAIRFAHLGHPIHEVKTRKRAIELLYDKGQQQSTPPRYDDVYVRGMKWLEGEVEERIL